jgi:hypothetical protein
LKLVFETGVMVTDSLDARLAAPSSKRRAARRSAKSFQTNVGLAKTAVINRRFSAKVRKSRMNHNNATQLSGLIPSSLVAANQAVDRQTRQRQHARFVLAHSSSQKIGLWTAPCNL